MNAHLSFLPISIVTPRDPSAPRLPGLPACNESSTLRRTSDPRYVLQIIDTEYPDASRIRSTLLVETATGKTLDTLRVISTDRGKTWKLWQGRL